MGCKCICHDKPVAGWGKGGSVTYIGTNADGESYYRAECFGCAVGLTGSFNRHGAHRSRQLHELGWKSMVDEATTKWVCPECLILLGRLDDGGDTR